MTVVYWNRTETYPPPEGVVVRTLSEGGMEQPLKRQDAQYFVPDGRMYVYYTPKFWLPLPKETRS